MTPSPLQLSRYRFTEVNIAAQQSAQPEDVSRIDVDVFCHAYQRSAENIRQWLVFVSVELKPMEGAVSPYLGKVAAFGVFSVAENWPEDQIEKLVFINGGGILYSAIREMICLITSRGVWDAVTIPSHSFLELHKKKAEAAAAQPVESTPSSKETA